MRQWPRADGLRRIAEYANAIGVQKEMVIREDAAGALLPTDLVADAHAAGLAVHAWTFRAENYFLPQAVAHGATTRPRTVIWRRRFMRIWLLESMVCSRTFPHWPGLPWNSSLPAQSTADPTGEELVTRSLSAISPPHLFAQCRSMMPAVINRPGGHMFSKS